MTHPLRATLSTLTAAALLGGALHATPAPGNGWCHLTPWTQESPQPSDAYGWRVEVGEGWAFVVHRGDRAVQVYRRDGGQMLPTQRIEDPAGPAGEGGRFGDTVLVDDGRLFVSAPYADLVGEEAGAVHRYDLVDDQWTLAETITSPSPTPGHRFGMSLDVDGEWLAAREMPGQGDAQVEVLRHDGQHWLAHATLQHPDAFLLGASVAVEGTDDGLYANVFASDSTVYGSQGAVFHFRVHPFGYQIGPAIQSPAPDPGDSYGYSIDFDGDHLVVGASWAEQLGQDTGAVHVFDVDGEVFPPLVGPAVTLLPEPNQVHGRFGVDVSVQGGRIAVGASQAFGNEVARTGAVYTYRPAIFGNGWDLEDRLTREGGQDDDGLGSAVALDGELVLAGAWQAGGSFQGEAVLFSLASRELDGGLAPADVLATAAPYGQGKAGALGVPELSLSPLPVPGELSVLGLSKVHQFAAPYVFFGLQPAAILFDQGLALVADPLVMALPVVGPMEQVGWGWQVPDDANLAGLEIFCQSVHFDQGGYGPKKLALSRGLRVVIGY